MPTIQQLVRLRRIQINKKTKSIQQHLKNQIRQFVKLPVFD
jgi:hypothetical protein